MAARRKYVFVGLLTLGVGCGGESVRDASGGGSKDPATGGSGAAGGVAGSLGQGGSAAGSGGGGGTGNGLAGAGGRATGGSGGSNPTASGGGFSVGFPSAGSNNRLYDIALDSKGSILVVGGVDGAFTIGSEETKGGVLMLRLDQWGRMEWGAVFGPSEGVGAASFEDCARAIAVESEGAFVVVGSYRSPLSFGGSVLSVQDADQGPDLFVAKFDYLGRVLWAHGYGSAGYDVATDVALDVKGNVYVTGYVSGTVDFGGGSRGAADQSAFVLKLDAKGNHQYSNVYSGTSNTFAGYGIGVDSTGAAWVTGYFKGTVDFGGELLSRSGEDLGAFLLGLSPAGEHVTSSAYGAAGQHVGFGLLVRLDGSLLMTGAAIGRIDFGGGPLGVEFASSTQAALYAAHFKPGGVYDWAKLASDVSESAGFGVTMDALGNYYVAGETVDLENSVTRPVLVTFDSEGNEMNRRIFDANGRFSSVAVDAAGNAYVTGWFQGSADFGFGELTGDNDLMIVKLPKE